jgi:hypothetical protein
MRRGRATLLKITSCVAQRRVTSPAFRAVVFIGITEHALLALLFRKICSPDSMQREQTEKVFCNAKKI